MGAHSRLLSDWLLPLLALTAFAPPSFPSRALSLTAQRSVASDTLLLDSFDTLSQWTTNPAQGVEVSVHPDSGIHGRAMRVDFDFHGHPGYWIVHRNVSLDLPRNYEFHFALRGVTPANNLEFRLVDKTGANVWWSRNLNFDFPAQWSTLVRRKRQICFAWGPTAGLDIDHVAAIEFAVSTGSGGKGSVWIDDLSLTSLRQDSPFDFVEPVASAPIVGSWESAVPNPDASGARLDFAADGSFSSTIGILGDFSYKFAKDRLTYTFTPKYTGRPEEHTIPVRINRDTLVQPGLSMLGRNVTMKRFRPATANDDVIVGEWEDVEGPEFVDFDANGKALVRISMKSCSGTWTAANGHLAIDLNGEVAERDYSIDNDVLTLRYSGNEIKYNRRTRAR